jgi:tryptophan-rich sensory protein
MSTTAMSLPLRSAPRQVNWTRFAILGPTAVVASVVANALFYLTANALVAFDAEFLPLASVGAPIIMTVAPAIVAVALYGALLRFARNPARIFTIVSAIVFIVTLIPDFTYTPTLAGSTDAQTAVLVTMHVIAAAVIVRLLTLANPRSAWAS